MCVDELFYFFMRMFENYLFRYFYVINYKKVTKFKWYAQKLEAKVYREDFDNNMFPLFLRFYFIKIHMYHAHTHDNQFILFLTLLKKFKFKFVK